MMLESDRRGFLGTGVAMSLAGSAKIPHDRDHVIEADLLRYFGYGIKRAGGVGDTACGEWLAHELASVGYRIERQQFAVPFFEATRADLVSGDRRAEIYPQPIVVTTGANGLSGPLVRVDRDGHASCSLKDSIALVDLPYARWSSMMVKSARGPVEAAFAAGAKAAVVVTNGPTGQVVALNTDGRKPMFSGPVALLAPDKAEPFLEAAMRNAPAILTITGQGGSRPAFNFVGRIDRRKGRWLAVSTPRSGWFGCAAERGPGVAAWLDLARWAVNGLPDIDLAFICNTGHEYEYLGAAEAMKKIAPPPDRTRFWLHLGANVAARDWHEIGMTPLPSVDSQRYLSASPQLLPLAQQLFAGQAGYEAPVSSEVLSAGELDEVIKAGYSPAVGVFGIHRFHHTAGDDERCLNPVATVLATNAFRNLVNAMVGKQT